MSNTITVARYRLQIHNMHIVKCPRCNNVILTKQSNRIYSNGVKRQMYNCKVCNMSFTCCAKRINKKEKKIYY